jgi:hypothetical protein
VRGIPPAIITTTKTLKSIKFFINRLKEVVSERDYMQMNSRLLLNLGLVCDLQQQDSAAVNYFKKV